MSRTGDILKSHPEAGPAKEALAAWEAEHDQLRQTVSELRSENEALKDRISGQEQKLDAARDIPEGYVEGQGVLWLVGADGRVEKLAYCPTCKLVMTPFPSDYPVNLVCTACKHQAPFAYQDLEETWVEINESARRG